LQIKSTIEISCTTRNVIRPRSIRNIFIFIFFNARLRGRCTYSLPCECNNAFFPFLLESEPPLFAGLLPREPVWLPGLFPREPRPPPRPFDLPHLAFSRWGLGPRVGDGFFTSTIRPPAKFIYSNINSRSIIRE